MDKFVAVVFGDEKAAYAGVRAFAEMNAEGSLDVAQVCVIKKEPNGTVSTKEVDDDFPIRTLAGTALGSLIGVLGGPVGLAIGATSGAYAGMIGDIYNVGLDEDFVADVGSALTPGKCAVIAEVDEEWVTPLDTRMESLGGVVYRTLKADAREDQRKREIASAKAELEQLKIEHAKAQADRKAKLQAHIDKINKRIDAKLTRSQEQARQTTQQFEARVKALQDKAEKEKGAAKSAFEARIAKLRKDYQSRVHA